MSESVVWEKIRERMEIVRRAIEEQSALTAAQLLDVLKARARELARIPEAAEKKAGVLQIIEFEIANERYGFELHSVREVFQTGQLVPVPGTPAFIAGVVNLRGDVLAVVDIRKFFELQEEQPGGTRTIILIENTEMRLGVLADDVLGVRAISHDQLQTSLPTLIGLRADYLAGVTGDGLVVLAATKILSDSRILIYEEVEN